MNVVVGMAGGDHVVLVVDDVDLIAVAADVVARVGEEIAETELATFHLDREILLTD